MVSGFLVFALFALMATLHGSAPHVQNGLRMAEHHYGAWTLTTWSSGEWMLTVPLPHGKFVRDVSGWTSGWTAGTPLQFLGYYSWKSWSWCATGGCTMAAVGSIFGGPAIFAGGCTVSMLSCAAREVDWNGVFGEF